MGDKAFLAVAAVVGHDDHFVGALSHQVFHDDEIARAAGKDAYHTVAGCLESLNDGEHRGHAHTAAGTYHCAEAGNVGGFAQRAYHIFDDIAHGKVAQLAARNAHALGHQHDGALLAVGFGNGERYAFAMLVDTYYHKVAGLAAPGYQRSFDLEHEHVFGKLLLGYDFIHTLIRFVRQKYGFFAKPHCRSPYFLWHRHAPTLQ